jgi:hypothetical protein
LINEEGCGKLTSPETFGLGSAYQEKFAITLAEIGTFNVALLQLEKLLIGLIIGDGLTEIPNDCGIPAQLVPSILVYIGVTAILPVIAAPPLFCAAKDGIFPIPEAAIPINVLLFVHEYEVPVPTKLTAAVAVPLQNT